MKKQDKQQSADDRFSLGLFGDTRSGKTVYLTDSIRHWLQQHISYGN